MDKETAKEYYDYLKDKYTEWYSSKPKSVLKFKMKSMRQQCIGMMKYTFISTITEQQVFLSMVFLSLIFKKPLDF